MHFPGECGNWLTVFVRACWCRCWRRLPRYSMRAGRGACLLARSRNLRIPHVISGRYSATRAQRTALTHTHTGLQGLHAVMVRGLNRREWALREACTCRTLSGPWRMRIRNEGGSTLLVSIPEFPAKLPEFPAKYQNFPQNQ